MAANNTNIGSSLLKFTFTDEDGEVVASFRMNPADIKLCKRCQEVSAYYESLKDRTSEAASIDEVAQFNDELEEKICYLLGYNARESLFGMISATSIMADGNMFAIHVMNKIVEVVGPEIKKRQKSMEKAAEYTAKYQK